MDTAAALKNVIYLKRTAEVAAKPDDFYRIVSDRPYRGAGCLAVNTSGPHRNAVIIHFPAGPFKAGETVTVSAYLRADPAMKIALFAWTTDSDDRDLQAKEQIREITSLSAEWRQVHVTAKLSKDAKHVWALVASLHEDATQRSFYVDEVKLERAAKPSPSEPAAAGDAAHEAPRPDFRVPFASTKPAIDGKLGDPCWAGALKLDQFIINDGKRRPAPQSVTAWVAHDGANIYFAARCEEKDLGRLSNLSQGRDRPDWADDRVEFFLDALSTGKTPVYYISVNSFGALTDQYLGVGEWDPKLDIATGREDGAWTLEMRASVSEMGRTTCAGEQWGMNIGRHHRGSARESSSLVVLEGKFSQPSRFALFTFEPVQPGQGAAVTSLSRGELIRAGFVTGANTAVYAAKTTGATKLGFVVENVSDGRILDRRVEERVVDGAARIEQPYKVFGARDEKVVFEVKDAGGATLYRNALELADIRPVFRVYDVKQPLYAELLDTARRKDARFAGNMIWGMVFAGYPSAIQSGCVWSWDKTRQEVSDAGFHLLSQYSPDLPIIARDSYVLRDRKSFPEHVAQNRERNWARPVLYSPYYIMGVDKDGKRGAATRSSGWLADPINLHAFIASVSGALDELGKDIWAVSAGDEQWGRQLHEADDFFGKVYDPAKPEHAWFRQAEEEIKRDYGFGRYGLPHRIKATDPDYPYCRRAYLTWLSDKLRHANRELRKAVKSRFPDMPIISEDSHGGSLPDVEYWSEYADVGTLQLQYNPDTGTMGYAFQTKLARDLSCLDYVIPCLHDCVAGFPTGALEGDELRELYSQAFRGGATGLHAWPASYGQKSVVPPLAPTLEMGYPLAWRWMIGVAKLSMEMPPLKFPKPDTAVLVSTESSKCGLEPVAVAGSLFRQIGVRAGGWLRFVSEATLELKKARFEDFRIVYVPMLQYTRRETAEALARYVEAGGVVVCFDGMAL